MDLRAKLAIGGGIVIVVVGLTIGLILSSSHVIDEGNVGIYYRFGKVMVRYFDFLSYQKMAHAFLYILQLNMSQSAMENRP